MPLRLVASEHTQLSKLMVVLYTFRYTVRPKTCNRLTESETSAVSS
jgi:hypothetical protein